MAAQLPPARHCIACQLGAMRVRVELIHVVEVLEAEKDTYVC